MPALERFAGFRHGWRMLLLMLLVASPAFSPGAAENAAEQRSAPTRVLFVGNSYLYYNDSLHNHVKRMLADVRPELADALQYKSATIGGARLAHHDIDWLLEPGRIGIAEPFDAVIMQGGSSEVLSESSREAFYRTATRYADKVRHAGARPYLYMTHAYVAPHRRARDDLIEDIAAAYIEAGKRAAASVIPVGLAFAESYRRRPDYPLHKHFDGTHPNLRGTYLAALMVVMTVYGDRLDSLSYTYFDELSAADVAHLRAVAVDVSERFRELQGRGPVLE